MRIALAAALAASTMMAAPAFAQDPDRPSPASRAGAEQGSVNHPGPGEEIWLPALIWNTP